MDPFELLLIVAQSDAYEAGRVVGRLVVVVALLYGLYRLVSWLSHRDRR